MNLFCWIAFHEQVLGGRHYFVHCAIAWDVPRKSIMSQFGLRLRAFPLHKLLWQIPLAAIILTTVISCPGFSNPSWYRYCNERFGQCADIPPGFRNLGEPANSDGLNFVASDGGMLTVSAIYNVLNGTVSSELKSFIHYHGKPQYFAKGGNWFVVSGWNGGSIYYAKVFVTANVISTIFLNYPSALKSKYDPIISRVSSSFSPAK